MENDTKQANLLAVGKLLEQRLRSRSAHANADSGRDSNFQTASQTNSRSQIIPLLARDGAVQYFPLSLAQQRLWFLQRLEPRSAFYNIAKILHLRGELDVAALARSFQTIADRHESLRTAFTDHGDHVAQAVVPAIELPLPVVDLRGLAPASRELEIQRLGEEEAGHVFDLARAPLLRVKLARLDDNEHVLYLTMHHIISDGWSLGVMYRELAALYRAFRSGQASPLPALPVQYADFAVWQRQGLESGALDKQLDYWKQQLAGALPRLDLPVDRYLPVDRQLGPAYPQPQPRGQPPPATGSVPPADTPIVSQHNYAGGRLPLSLPDDLAGALKALGRRERTTLFMTMLAAWQLLLSRYSGEHDVLLGTPIAARNCVETEPLIGFFIGTLVLRTDVSGAANFRELLQSTRETALAAYANQDVPFEKLVEELQPERQLGRNPIFDVLINYVPAQVDLLQLDGIETVQRLAGDAQSKFALTLYIRPSQSRLTVELAWQRAMFSSERAAGMLGQYRYLLEQICAAPDQPLLAYSLVTPHARALLPDPALPLAEPRFALVAEEIARWAAQTPAAIAVGQGRLRWSYSELWQAALSLAHTLHGLGLQPGDVVAIRGSRSFGVIAAMVGVLAAGGVLLTVDRNLPIERQRILMREAHAQYLVHIGVVRREDDWLRQLDMTLLVVDSNQIVVEKKRTWEEADARRTAETSGVQGSTPGSAISGLAAPHAAVLPAVAPDDPAYIFFTSGTKGTPKGILGNHKGLSHFLDWQRTTFSITPQDRFAQLTGLSFDVLLRDVLLPLTSGASLHLPDFDDPAPDLAAAVILPWLVREEISALHTVPALAQSWLADSAACAPLPKLRRVFFSGEPLSGALINRWREAFGDGAEIVNLYGPTETTMAKCYYRVPAASTVDGAVLPDVQPIGRPISHTQALVLNAGGALCGIGELGEIVLRTSFRTLGYINAADEQRRRFVRNPFRDDADDVLYFTGDRGRYRPDGAIDIFGRADDQVKINGVRVEPGEVGAALSQHPAVQACTVIARRDGHGDLFLAAYVVATRGRALTASELRTHLGARLPAALIPAAFVFLDAMPLTANGKIDRAALPAPDLGGTELAAAYAAPRTATETNVAAIWSELLKRDRVGVDDNFFDLGGHSLLAMRIIARIRRDCAVELPLSILFEAPTVAAMAAAISAASSQRDAQQDAQRDADDQDLLAGLDALSAEEADLLLRELESEAAPSQPGGAPI